MFLLVPYQSLLNYNSSSPNPGQPGFTTPFPEPEPLPRQTPAFQQHCFENGSCIDDGGPFCSCCCVLVCVLLEQVDDSTSSRYRQNLFEDDSTSESSSASPS